MERATLPPGPKPLPFFGNLPSLIRNGPRAFERLRETYGDHFTFHSLGGRKWFFLTDPDDIRDVLVTHHKDFTKGRALGLAKTVLGEGLLTGDGEPYQKARRVVQGAFHGKRLPDVIRAVHKHLGALQARWRDGGEIDLAGELSEYLLKVTGEGFLGVDISAEAKELSGVFSDAISALSILNTLPDIARRLPLPINFRLKRLTRSLGAAADAMIERHPGSAAQDVIALMLAARNDPSQEALTREQMRAVVTTTLFGGYEAPMHVLTWAWYRIAREPEVQAKLQREADGAFAGSEPGPGDAAKFPYAKAVALETLRLYPPVWLIARRITKPYPFRGHLLPAGAEIFLSPYLVQRSPRYFDDPLAFKPERWEAITLTDLPQFAFFPFGGGPRGCLGEQFAWPELILTIASIARRWELRLKDAREVKPRPYFTFCPDARIKMLLKARGG
jgi:cytochrome P450